MVIVVCRHSRPVVIMAVGHSEGSQKLVSTCAELTVRGSTSDMAQVPALVHHGITNLVLRPAHPDRAAHK
jgi:hypothetical protein